MQEFDENALNKLTELCHIECTDDERKALKAQMEDILKYIELLATVDTQGVEPCYRILETLKNVMREDEVKELLPREQFLANAPSHVGGMIRIPPVIKFTTE